MSIVADVTVRPTAFLLSHTLEERPDVELKVIREVFSEEPISPFLWARSNEIDAFRQALAGDGSVGQAALVDAQGNGSDSPNACLLRVDWNIARVALLKEVADHQGAVIRARYKGADVWQLSVMFPERAALAGLHDNGTVDFELERVTGHHLAHRGPSFGLTAEQREALIVAHRAGYFEIPRERTLSEVAEDLDISANALSARLRRGFRTLVDRTLVE